MDLNHEEVLLKFEVPGEFLLKELQEMYDNSSKLDSCDVKIMCRDRHTINTHSALLAVVSPYLKILLSESWSPHQCASIILPDFNGRDVQNLIKFLYTGRASLNETEFEVFQQLIYELQIRTEEETAIILEQIHRNDKETSEHDKETAEQNNETKAIDSIITLELSPNMKDVSIEVPTATDIITTDYLCPICSVSFTCPSQLKNHKNIHELQYEVDLILDDDSVVKKRPTLSCELCPSAAFSSQSKLNDHMLKHTGERPFKCSYCDKSYPVKATLTAHLRLHANEKPHQCERCGKAFLIRSLLEQHLRTHTNERPFACDVCGKAFRNQSNLIGHKKTHTGDRPHACPVCSKSFNRKHDLDAHLRIHTGDKPFSCTQCTKSFRFRSALRVHLKGVHKPNSP